MRDPGSGMRDPASDPHDNGECSTWWSRHSRTATQSRYIAGFVIAAGLRPMDSPTSQLGRRQPAALFPNHGNGQSPVARHLDRRLERHRRLRNLSGDHLHRRRETSQSEVVATLTTESGFPENYRRIGACGATRGQPAGDRCTHRQRDCRYAHREWVAGRHPVEQRGDVARCKQARDRSSQ